MLAPDSDYDELDDTSSLETTEIISESDLEKDSEYEDNITLAKRN